MAFNHSLCGTKSGRNGEPSSLTTDRRNLATKRAMKTAEQRGGDKRARPALNSQSLREWGVVSAPRLDDAALRVAGNDLVELLLKRRKSRPTGNRSRKVHVLPFIVITRLGLQKR
jgi:hypothetical protein